MSGGERTAEEREAARRERERRRAQQQQDGREPVAEAGRAEPEPAAAPEPAVAPELPLAALEPADQLDDEAPAGTKRVSRAQRPVSRPRPKRPPHPKRHRPSWLGRAVSVLALIVAAALIWFLVELFQPFHGSGHGSVTVTISPHSSAGQIGDLLEREGVISSSFFFELRATLDGDRSDLRAGTYHLKLGMSYASVLSRLTTAPPAAKVTVLTIVEGDRRAQIAALLRAQGVRGSYLAATRHSPLIDPRSFGAPRRLDSLEGFLFPSTYQLRVPISVGALVADQLRTFKREFATVNLAYARRRHLTPYDVLIIGSMIQAEAQTKHDLPLVSSVIYNRLAAGMLLQIDATVRYAVGNYKTPITVSQLHSSSPWNTYTHKGLPPTPIDNPGLAAMQAAAHPARTNYLYFVVKPCGNGEHAFASTYAQFQREEQQYQVARLRRGGHSPAHC